jgi:hypothetical protein
MAGANDYGLHVVSTTAHEATLIRRARTSQNGGSMPATEPEQIHGMFEQAFNAGDIEVP